MPLARSILLHAAGLVVIAIGSGAGCDDDAGGDDTDGFGTDPVSSGTDGDPSLTTTNASTTNASTTNASTTNPSTTNPATTDDPDTSATDTSATDPTDTSAGGCGSGSFTFALTDRDDQYGHFPYLLLFYPEAPPTHELFETVIGEDGSVTLEVLPRDAGSGSGHSGLTGLTGTIDGACTVAIDTEADFVSDTGPFGTIQVQIDGTFPAAADGQPTASLTLQGGGIPQGPITYVLQGQ